MRIDTMTATFGKLEHQSLSLKPGLNVIHAPNEWGKSTWCAFLLAMLYGLDTRAKGGGKTLPEKERYAPWSGSPMSGRVELNWNGRDITIERTTKGRIPLGAFRAYETHTGMEVPELDGSNCGFLLLGVERSVYQRAGFIRLSDLPVTQDEALRRRLNQLVTTGDDSGDQAKLEKGLRELKNRCRYNRSGLLPQAIAQREGLCRTLEELEALEERQQQTEEALEQNAAQQKILANHTAALAYEQFCGQREKLTGARESSLLAGQKLEQLEAACRGIPSQEEIEKQLSLLRDHRGDLEAFQEAQSSLPLPPEPPQAPACFLGLNPDQAREQAELDAQLARKLRRKWWWLLLTAGGFSLLGAAVLLWLHQIIPGGILAGAGCLSVGAALAAMVHRRRSLQGLASRYGSLSPRSWKEQAEGYLRDTEEYRQREANYRRNLEALAQRRRELKQQHQKLCGDASLEQSSREWEQYRRQHWELENARQEANQAQREYESLKAMLHPVPPPSQEDTCSLSVQETAIQAEQLRQQERQLRRREGECRGRMEALGSREEIQTQLSRLEERIAQLQRYDRALALAQQTLTQASGELQRRFAPRISREAQRLFSRMTGGAYDRLTLSQDFSLLCGTRQEDALREAQWRSDGTIDQLYLALRLSTAQALTPEAPLILDDALVRFDDARMGRAMEVLQELSQSRQVILFTCQQREAEFAAALQAQQK